jgi:hypothetical protein
VNKNEATSGIANGKGKKGHQIGCSREKNEAKTRRNVNRKEVASGRTNGEGKKGRLTNYSSPAVQDEGVGASEGRSQLGTPRTAQSIGLEVLEWSRTSTPRSHTLQNLQASHTTAPPSGPRTRIMQPTPDLVEELMAIQRTLPSWKAC